MARIIVLNVQVPFVHGGQDVLVNSLIKELKLRGHEADVVAIPYAAEPKELLAEQIAFWRALPLTRFGGKDVDLIISTKFPSYFAKHPAKSLWLVHQHRPIYDLYAGSYSDFSDDPRDEALRELIVKADKQAISECQCVSGISKNVINRLEKFNGVKGEVLYPPLSQGNNYYTDEAEPYFLSVSRLCRIKRVDLMLKALPGIHNNFKLKIVGKPDEPGIMDYLNNEIKKHHLEERVEFLGRVSDEELLELYAKSYGVFYGPHDEDYGYVTLEAMASSKPVISCNDSGGVLEFLKHNENALISNPTTEGIASSCNQLIENKELAIKLGKRGREDFEKLGLHEQGWDNVIDTLLRPINQKIKKSA